MSFQNHPREVADYNSPASQDSSKFGYFGATSGLGKVDIAI